ncbi:MAG TPA: FG-GAP-like repeat-containing protein, partial [Saprospiraceae bacterium]
NMNAPASIYKNVSPTNGHYLQVKLKGPGQNLDGLGCSVMVYAGGKKQIHTMQTSRGYFSAVEPILHFGLGGATRVDSLKVYWDHQTMSVVKNVDADDLLTIDYAKAKKVNFIPDPIGGIILKEVEIPSLIRKEKEFNDYTDQVLLPYKLSQNGPHISIGDLNGDGREDYFIGGSAGYPGVVFFQNATGQFEKSIQPALEADANAEDQESAIMDIDTDGDADLIIVSGSNEFKDNNPLLKVRLYLNDGKGTLTKAGSSTMPDLLVNGQCVEAFDADGDKDIDLFIGGRLVGGKYAIPAASKLLINQSGVFKDLTSTQAPIFEKMGMITDAIVDDIDKDGDADLLAVGEWMKPSVLLNDGKGKFTLKEIESAGSGLWWTIEKGDFDNDGDSDFILGNLGWNNKFGGSRGTKLEVYSNDIDQNGDFDVVLATTKKDQVLPVRGRECSSQEVPYILEKFPTYESYANAKLTEIYPEEALEKSVHRKLSTMSSVYLQNNGDVTFTSTDLPISCQVGPVKAFFVDDFNGDQLTDFIYGGNHLPTEVETARYDGLYPGICYGDGKGNFKCMTAFDKGRLKVEDVRDIRKINTADGRAIYLFSYNNQPMKAYLLNQ